MDNIENSDKKLEPAESKPTSKAQAKRNSDYRSAIYRLTPQHRRFVLALRRNQWNQKQSYLEVFPTVKPESAEQSASRLMTRLDIKQAIEEMYDELNVVELETFERVLSRFVKEAESAEKSSDRIQASNYIAKMQRHITEDSVNKTLIVADSTLLDSLRDTLSKYGKMPVKSIDPVIDAHPEPAITVEPHVEP